MGRPQAAQESPRRGDALPVVTGGAQVPGDDRLAEVMAEGREHEGRVVAGRRCEAPRRGRGRAWCAPHHVSFRMPARVLGDSDERIDLREETHEPGLAEEGEADGGQCSEDQRLADFRVDPLRGQFGEVEPASEADQLVVGLEFETGRELRGAKSPERIIGELIGIDGPEPPRREVRPPAMGGRALRR